MNSIQYDLHNRAAARNIKNLFIEISHILDDYTAKVCPECSNVCCRQKHAVYSERDKAYLRALDVVVPHYDTTRPAEGPCQFLGLQGCVLPRWQRPWKCTWYFCDALLEAMAEGPQRKVRRLSAVMQEIMLLYNDIADSTH